MSKSKKQDKSRDYTRKTRDRLHLLSGNQCYAPDCNKSLIARDGESLIRKICHIEAASKEGPRFNPSMNDDDRRAFDNLILLCDECHTMIDNLDNIETYTVEVLKEWKKDHESKYIHSKISQPSLLNEAIIAVSEIDIDYDGEALPDLKSFDIEEKLNYNNVVRHRSLVGEYKVCYSKINKLYEELESQGSFRKVKLLRNVRSIYLKVKGAYVGNSKDPQAIINEKSDEIWEDVENELLMLVGKQQGVYKEDLLFGITLIIVDAFMRCKILEKPMSNDS